MRGEFELIAKFFAPLAEAAPGAQGLRNDAALFDPAGDDSLVLTVDAMVAGVHFLPEDPPETIGRKLLRVNLSDLAAMGARPRGYLLTTAFPKDIDEVLRKLNLLATSALATSWLHHSPGRSDRRTSSRRCERPCSTIARCKNAGDRGSVRTV